jgi:hypothetical protein
MTAAGHVFGYGSLVGLPGAARATLRGHRRVWGVAMDNSVAVPGYKVYEAPEGARPPVAVAFLDLVADPACDVEGALLEVDAGALAALDARERQYERIVVTGAVDPAPPGGGPVWTFVGRAAGRARVRDGGPVVVQRAYVDLVEAAFAALGDDALARYRASTEPSPFPVVELARVDLPI